MREKSCVVCGTRFTPLKPMMKVCGAPCAIKYAIDKRDKKRAQTERMAKAEARKVIKLQKEKTRRPSYYADKAQVAVNAYRRALLEGEPCMSCGKHTKHGKYHAGHYIPRGRMPALRYTHENIWLQCYSCNVSKSGNAIEYRKALVARMGAEKVEWLEGPHEFPHWKKEDYERIESEHKKLLKELKDEKESV